jgi:ferric-dicitrate binding protein FerR (iron transport regulator)
MGGIVGGSKPDNSAAMAQIEQQRQETERMRMQSEKERRDLSEKMAAKRRASARGGSRMLLADTRLSPETGIDDEEKTKLG